MSFLCTFGSVSHVFPCLYVCGMVYRTPRPVEALRGLGVCAISCGAWWSMAVTVDGYAARPFLHSFFHHFLIGRRHQTRKAHAH